MLCLKYITHDARLIEFRPILSQNPTVSIHKKSAFINYIVWKNRFWSLVTYVVEQYRRKYLLQNAWAMLTCYDVVIYASAFFRCVYDN